ncbi:hypothetical protein PPYR_03359 [Photinus pyralis]|uniref:Large ribosomal subunit protein mL44 n=1 Tax=Photinus pyralis TaxID=7054 RepID=A0A1Y1KXD2_PHOPY|nr:39S ribosomal protein L44, mitochondrial [Photinus pyralis]KAB0791559.1 hypothetical protein PPYR_03359 [Photinus pyralis]
MASFLKFLALLPPRAVLSPNLTAKGIKRWVAPTLIELERRRKRQEPQPPIPRSSFLEWNHDAELYSFGKRLGEEFNQALLKRAFTHRSYVVQKELAGNPTDTFEDNSELISEGNSIILKSVRQQYTTFPDEIVEALCNHLVNNTMLAHVAYHLGTKDIVLTAEYPAEASTLADTFRAIVAALHRSTGEDRAHLFVKDFLLCQLNGKGIFDIWDPKNPYEVLKQLAQENGVTEIEARLCNESASNTILANYQVGLYSEKKLLGIGWGESIEIAKDTAALNAIHRIYNLAI